MGSKVKAYFRADLGHFAVVLPIFLKAIYKRVDEEGSWSCLVLTGHLTPWLTFWPVFTLLS